MLPNKLLQLMSSLPIPESAPVPGFAGQGLGGAWRRAPVAYSARTALLTAEQPIR
jgi:hypothetical protein